MKTKKVLASTVLIVFAVCSMGAQRIQCGVSNAQIISYLDNCPHHHSACCVVDIPGTCNSTANIENCGTATVYVIDGSIVGHLDSPGNCGQ